MSNSTPTRLVLIGCGSMARHHLRRILPHFPQTELPLVCEPSAEAYEETAALVQELGRPAPRNEPDLGRLLAENAGTLDAALIVTPHLYHHDQAKACLEAGLDVLLEKPMTMTAAEAASLMETRDRTGRLLVVAFQGSLSPQVRQAVTMLRSGQLGRLITIHGSVWQGWAGATAGRWRQQPHIAGGGFLFDTGAHLMNTVSDLAGEPFAQVSAWLDQRDRPVDILGVVMGRTPSGVLVTLHFCGDTGPVIGSDIRLFCTQGMLRTGAWGGWLDMQQEQEAGWQPVPVPASLGVWQQFLAVRQGSLPNPCPPEMGLRLARLWDAIQLSAAQDGQPISLTP